MWSWASPIRQNCFGFLSCAIHLEKRFSHFLFSLSNIENNFVRLPSCSSVRTIALLKNTIVKWFICFSFRFTEWKGSFISIKNGSSACRSPGNFTSLDFVGAFLFLFFSGRFNRTEFISRRRTEQWVKKRFERLLSIASGRRLCGMRRGIPRVKFYRLHSDPFSRIQFKRSVREKKSKISSEMLTCLRRAFIDLTLNIFSTLVLIWFSSLHPSETFPISS